MDHIKIALKKTTPPKNPSGEVFSRLRTFMHFWGLYVRFLQFLRVMNFVVFRAILILSQKF
jgi:hypothetical protein